MSAGYEFDTTTLRFTYSSMTTPAQVYDYDMETRARTLRKTPGGAERPRPRRLRHAPPLCAGARRRDGAGLAALPQGHAARRLRAAVPLRLRRLRHLHPGRRSRPTRLSLVDRGFIFAIAHIRGGKDKGYRWYTERQAREEGATPSPTSSPPASYLVAARATPSAAASSPTAARPAAC